MSPPLRFRRLIRWPLLMDIGYAVPFLVLLLAFAEFLWKGTGTSTLTWFLFPIAGIVCIVLLLPITQTELLPANWPEADDFGAGGAIETSQVEADTRDPNDLQSFLFQLQSLNAEQWTTIVNWAGRSELGRWMRERRRLMSLRRVDALELVGERRDAVALARKSALECLNHARPQATVVDRLLAEASTPDADVVQAITGEIWLRAYVEEASTAIVLKSLLSQSDFEVICRPFDA